MEHVTTEEMAGYQHSHISWGAIIAGWVLSAAIAMLLYFLGSAVGITTINVSDGEAIGKGLALGTLAWVFFSWVISLYLGGLFASWLHGEGNTKTGTIEGMTVWALASILTIALGISGLSALFQAGSVLGKAVGAGVAASGAAASVSANDPVSQQLMANFEQEIKESVSQATAETSRGAVSAGEANQALNELDQQTIASIGGHLIRGNTEEAKNTLARNTNLSREEVDSVIQGFAQRTEQLKGELAQAADQAASYATTAMWTLFFSSALGLLAAALGGRAGSRYATKYAIEGRKYAHT